MKRPATGLRNVAAPIRLYALLLSVTAVSQQADATSAETAQHQLGSKYSTLAQINRDNVAILELAWE